MPGRDHGIKSVSWWGATVPTTGPTGTSALWLGVQFGIEVPGWIQGFRVYVDSTEDGNYWAVLWDRNTLEVLRALSFRVRAQLGANAWQQGWIRPQLRHDDTARSYRLAVLMPVGKRYQTNNRLTAAVQQNNITFENGFTSTALAIVRATPTLSTFAPGVDILFHPD